MPLRIGHDIDDGERSRTRPRNTVVVLHSLTLPSFYCSACARARKRILPFVPLGASQIDNDNDNHIINKISTNTYPVSLPLNTHSYGLFCPPFFPEHSNNVQMLETYTTSRSHHNERTSFSTFVVSSCLFVCMSVLSAFPGFVYLVL